MKKGGISNKQLRVAWLVAACTIFCSLLVLVPIAGAKTSGIAVVSTRAQWDAAFADAKAGRIDVIRGCLMVAKDGGMFAFGDARFYGTGNQRQFSTAAPIAPNGSHDHILDARGGTLCRGNCP